MPTIAMVRTAEIVQKLSLCSTSRPAFHALRSSNFRIYDTFITISNYLCSTSRPAFHALRSSNFRIYDTFITISNYQKLV